MPPMKRAKIVKLSLDELAGVDAGAQAEAGSVILKRKEGRTAPVSTLKRAAITTAVLGHTHLLNGVDDMQSGCTSSERTSDPHIIDDSYRSYHSHPWVRTDDGTIVLGESGGHTHEIAVAAASLATSEVGKSTTAPAIPTVKTIKPSPTERTTMKTLEEQFADLTKRHARLVALSGVHKAHLDTLSGDDAEAFLAKSTAEREAVVKAALEDDKPIYTGEVTKIEVRKRDGELALQLAKQNEANAVTLAKQSADIEKAELVDIAKATIGNFGGDVDVHAYVIKSIRKGGGDAATVTKAFELLKGGNAAFAQLAKMSGVEPKEGVTGGNPLEVWNANVATYAEKNGIKDLGKAEDKFLTTSEGLVAKRAYDDGSAALRRAQT